MKILFMLLFLIPMLGNAETVQWAHGFTAGCTDPVERTDGTPLLPEEIARVEYYIDKVDGNTDPEMTLLMTGGCNDMHVDTKVFTIGDYYRYAKAWDTSDPALESDYSAGILFTIQKARPKPPTGLR